MYAPSPLAISALLLLFVGTFRYASGNVEVGRYKADADVGEAAKWSADRQAAWRLQDGKVVEQISLEEAREIAARVGEPVPA